MDIGVMIAATAETGDVTEIARAVEDLTPVHHARADVGDGGSLAVVQHAAGARSSAELQEIDTDAVLVGPEDVLGANAGFAGVVGDQPA